jgi:N4-gp56 family major capsid protein
MSKTGVLPGDNEAQKAWHKEFYDQVDKYQKLAPLEGGRDSVIYRKNELSAQKGARVYFGLKERLDQGFLPNGTAIEGNETSLTTHMTSLDIEMKNFGIRDDGPLSRQASFYDMDAESLDSVQRQIAENIDREYTTALQATNMITYYEAAGVASLTANLTTAQNAVTAADKVSPEMLTRLKNVAMSYRSNGFTPLEPVNVGNGEHFFWFYTNHDALADMENDSTFVASQQQALERAKDNPLFRGSYAVWRGIVFLVTDNGIQTGTATVGNTQPYVRSHLLGARALCSAWVNDGQLVSKKFDYDQEHGLAYISMWNTKKSAFATNSGSDMTHGSIDVITARSQLTDITMA